MEYRLEVVTKRNYKTDDETVYVSNITKTYLDYREAFMYYTITMSYASKLYEINNNKETLLREYK